MSALVCRARLLDAVGSVDEAMRMWRSAAKCGDVEGQLVLGLALYRGTAGLAQDPEDAHIWLSKAWKQVKRVLSCDRVCLALIVACCFVSFEQGGML